MCRLFGLIANKEVDIKFSMLEASNKFKEQSKYNPHGWGIGYYKSSNPQVMKKGEKAFISQKFDNLVKEIRAKIFIAHVRYASSGSANSDKNAHPFLYKNWIFAHNGTIHKDRIERQLVKPYNENFTSEPIDSEIYFRILIQCIEEENDIIKGIKKGVKEVIKDSNGANFILSDGENLYSYRYGRELFFLIRDPKSFQVTSVETQALIESKSLIEEKAILIATEKITKNEPWKELEDNTLLICRADLNYEVVNL